MDKKTEKAIRAIVEQISFMEAIIIANTNAGSAQPLLGDRAICRHVLLEKCGLKPESETTNENQ